MNTLQAISERRSIRKFLDTPIDEDALQKILIAAGRAPSGKNRQPWQFVVVRGGKRAEMVRVMREAMAAAKARGDDVGSGEGSARVMEQAPITVFVFHPQGSPPWKEHSISQMFDDVVDIQSTGAAVQNMLLAATELGLGSLWMCDVFYAYEELSAWLGQSGEMIAAVALGHPAEHPEARPRKPMGEIVREA